MKKIIVVMAVAIMVALMIPISVSAGPIRNALNWDGHSSHGSYYGGYYHHGRGYCRDHGGVAKIVEMKMQEGNDQKYMVVFHDGHIAVVCANGQITAESGSRTVRDTIGIAGVLGALGILVGAH